MPFFLFSLIVFFAVIKRQPRDRSALVMFSLLFYVCLILFEQVYLEYHHGRSFEYSDATQYFYSVADLSLEGLMDFIFYEHGVSNKFYYLLNWIYANTLFQNAPATGILLKITNAIYFLFAYILLRGGCAKSNRLLDWLILFHPWLIFLIIRNVRDAYIIFLLAFLVHYSLKERVRVFDFVATCASVISMYFVRPMLVAPMLIGLFLWIRGHIGRWQRAVLVLLSLTILSAVGYSYKDEITLTAVNGFLGNAVYFAGEDLEEAGLMRDDVIASGALTSDFKALLLNKLKTSFPVFLFTPHPYNWSQKYIDGRDNGVYGIYTDIDNILIIIGSIINYIIFLPLLFKYVSNIRQINAKYIVVPLFIMIVYSVFLFGNADLRIRYTWIFFIVFGFYGSGLMLYKRRADIKYLLLSIAVLLAIPIVT